MKRILLYIVALGLLVLSPVEEADIGTLRPVGVIMISQKEESYWIETDTGDWGCGETVQRALENLKSTTPGTIYMDTAEYVLIEINCEEVLQIFQGIMNGRVRICGVENQVNLKEAALFLSVHGDLPQLKAWSKGMELPILTVNEKRMKLL